MAAVSTRWRYRAFFVASPSWARRSPWARTRTARLRPSGRCSSARHVIDRRPGDARPPGPCRSSCSGSPVLLAAGLAALARPAAPPGRDRTAWSSLLAVVGLPPLWTGRFFGKNLQRPEDVPGYWQTAAAYLDSRGNATRVLEIPGSDFASYRWGTTIDPITPGSWTGPMRPGS